MSDKPTSKSIHDLPPLERGGVEARKGFEFQDHVAAGFLIEMLVGSGISQVWCETHDDITVIWNGNEDEEVEFVQVKALALDQLWSVAKLADRDRKDKKSVAGSSIIERSLANDRCDQPTSFRLVTTLPPKGDLDFLQLPFDAPDRKRKTSDMDELVADLKKRTDDFRSPNKNGVEYWLRSILWDVYQSDESIAASNKLKLQRSVVSLGHHLFPDELDELYLALLAKARDAATANWGENPELKKLEVASLSAWLRGQVEARRSPPPVAGTRLEEKLKHAGIGGGDITACLESRQQYLMERYRPKYLKYVRYTTDGKRGVSDTPLSSGESRRRCDRRQRCVVSCRMSECPRFTSIKSREYPAATLRDAGLHVQHCRPLRPSLSEGDMKSIKNINADPIGVPLSADELLEFHAARLLLLFRFCGTAGRIEGLTKMAKLDFFVRYPEFFNTVCKTLGLPAESATQSVESSMIRFHYGPWDDRYYHVLAYLESRELLTVSKDKNAFRLSLTDQGTDLANTLASDDSYASLVEQMKRVKKTLGGKAGSTLKKLVYQVFEKEVAERRMGETIE